MSSEGNKISKRITMFEGLIGKETTHPVELEREKVKREKKVIDHPVELEREKVETWLKGFLPKLERSTTRTQKCRLLESVERMHFGDDYYAVEWDHVKFGEDGLGEIFKKDRKLEDFAITNFQQTILKEENSLIRKKIGRSEIKQESGEWKMSVEMKTKTILQGGEAIVLKEDFDGLKVAVRVQVFDIFLFTEKFKREDISFEIHLSKDFEAAKDESSKNEDQIPLHKNVIRNYVNVEFFHSKDEGRKDCLGWLTIMEKAEENLRKLLKNEKIDIDERKKIASGITDGMSYLKRCGIDHKDQKLENFLVLQGEVKIIDFGLIEERTGRSGYRKMGYTRRGSKYKESRALAAGSPGFTGHDQITRGLGYYVDNIYFFLLCDWKTAWTLLYQPIDEIERKEIDKILKNFGAASITDIIRDMKDDYFRRRFFEEVNEIISLKNASNVCCLYDPHMTQSCNMASLKQNATKSVQDGMLNLTKNILDQKSSNLCVPISVTTLLRHAIKNDLDFGDYWGNYTFENILATLTMIVFPRSLAGLNLNPNKEEQEKQTNQVDILLKRLCQKTYLMESGWEIIRKTNFDCPESTCQFHPVTLNEKFVFTRPATVTGAFLHSSGGLVFHQMTLDRLENDEYVLQNTVPQSFEFH